MPQVGVGNGLQVQVVRRKTAFNGGVFAQQINSFIFRDSLRSKNYLGRDSGPLNTAPTS